MLLICYKILENAILKASFMSMLIKDLIYATKGIGVRKKTLSEKILSERDVKALFDAVKHNRTGYEQQAYITFWLQANLGFRIGEVERAEFSDFENINRNIVKVHTVKRKFPTVDEIYISDQEKQALSKILADIKQQSGRLIPYSKRTLHYLFSFYARTAGLPAGISSHALRRFCATQIKTYTNPVYADLLVKLRLRHVLDATERYFLLSPDDLVKLYNQKPVIL
jgi:integrase